MSKVTEAQPSRGASSEELPIFVTEDTRRQLMTMYDDALRRWPVPFDEFFVETVYGRTHVIASGDTRYPPLVLIHPMGVGGFVWSSIMASLAEHWRTFALDTIGDVGKSELADPTSYPKTGSDYSGWLDQIYEGLGLTVTDIVAGSMGGWIAMNHAINRPDSLRRLVLLGPMGLPPWRATLAVLAPFMSQRLRPSPEKLDRIITRSLGGGDRVNRELRPWMRVMGNTKALVGQPFHLPGRRLRAIHAPTLLFLGGKDGLVGDASRAVKRARRNIGDCKIEVLPNAGHVMSIDEPEIVASHIVDFLRGTDNPD